MQNKTLAINGIACTPWQSHPKKHRPKNIVLDDATNFQTAFPYRPKDALNFSEPILADGLAADPLPWVTRSQVLLRFDRDLVRDCLPRVIQVFPLRGIDCWRILKGFQNGSSFGNPNILLALINTP